MWAFRQRVFVIAVALLALAAVFSAQAVAGVGAVQARQHGASPSAFLAGAASISITPPAWTRSSDSAFVPACGSTPAAVSRNWPGPRLFAFTDPYIDVHHLGHYVVGDPYCDAGLAGRYQAPYLAGGVGTGRWPTAVQAGNPITAQAIVVGLHEQRIALVVVDSIGLFNSTMDKIRAAARSLAQQVSQIFISSTHDESAPDPIGLWGPSGATPVGTVSTPTAVSSGVDNFYLAFLVHQVARAIAEADARVQPATMRLAYMHMPGNLQSCWVSYPYIDDQLIPIMQLASSATHRVIATLVNANTHVVTLAFSGVARLTTMISADWPGVLRTKLQEAYPGSVAVELSGLVGAIGDPTLYQPASTQVLNIPGPVHSPPGNPVKCLESVYPNPTGATPLAQPLPYMQAYGGELATDAVRALQHSGHPVVPTTLVGQQAALCIQVENTFFAAAFVAGLIPDRPAYVDPTCSVGSPADSVPAPRYHLPPGHVWGANPLWVKTNVGVLTIGSAQFAYTPGEVFPFTEILGHIDPAQMPFPTTCYSPASGSYSCGQPLSMTPWITARMTQPYKFLAGLGEDMLGYLFPPGNFVGSPGETTEQPWAGYEMTTTNGRNGNDRFGQPHVDDTESVGPHAGLEVTTALAELLARDGPGAQVLPGSYVDAQGRTSDSPFAGPSFSGAVGVEVREPSGRLRAYRVGCNARGWVTFDGTLDPGTAGTTLPYSVSTAGVLLPDGRPLLVDVFLGAAGTLGRAASGVLRGCPSASAAARGGLAGPATAAPVGAPVGLLAFTGVDSMTDGLTALVALAIATALGASAQRRRR